MKTGCFILDMKPTILPILQNGHCPSTDLRYGAKYSISHNSHSPYRANSGLNISPKYNLKVSSETLPKLVCYGIFCPLGMNELR